MPAYIVRVVPLIIAALLLMRCASSDDRCDITFATEVPLKVADRGLLLASMTVDTGIANMIVDTGAAATTLTSAAAQRLDQKSSRLFGVESEGIGGYASTSLARPHHLQLGTLKGSNFSIFATDFSMGEAVDGLLGMDILGAYDVDFDIAGGRLILLRAKHHCVKPATVLTGNIGVVPITRRGTDYSPIVDLRVGDKHFSALIDTGAAGSVVYPDTAEALGLLPAQADEKSISMNGVGPLERRGVARTIHDVHFGEVTVTHLQAYLINSGRQHGVDLILGRDILHRMHLWLSNSSNTLLVQYPPLPTPLPRPVRPDAAVSAAAP